MKLSVGPRAFKLEALGTLGSQLQLREFGLCFEGCSGLALSPMSDAVLGLDGATKIETVPKFEFGRQGVQLSGLGNKVL